MLAGGVYGWRVARREAKTAGETLVTMFGAWGTKLVLVVAQLFLVLSLYGDLVHAAFIAAFVVTVGVFAAAIVVRDAGGNKTFD